MNEPDDVLSDAESGKRDEALDEASSGDEAADSTPQDADVSGLPKSPLAGLSGPDRRAATDAYRKVLAGQSLTVREQSLVKRLEKEKEERLRWQYYASIPQKHWREMSGRQTKVLNEQAARYGLPFGGATINLPTLARALHEFLADNAHKLAKEDDELLQGVTSPALERYREERALMARLDRLERERQLLPRDEVRMGLARVAHILRSAGETLQRQFGVAAVEILNEALEDAEREIDRAFSASLEPSEDPPDAAEQLASAE